jgi:hypothetical protein
MRLIGKTLLSALLGAALLGQDLQFAISTEDGRSRFYLGEVIALELRFSGGRGELVSTREVDRVGRVNNEDEFLVEPSDGVVDPLRGLDGERGGMGGLAGGPANLRDGPVVVRRCLNDWVRFLRPGVYRLRVKSRRVAGVVLESNALQLEIVEAPREWVAGQIAKAVESFQREPIQAARMLRSLASLDAHKELMGRLEEWDQAGFLVYSGVLGSPYRRELLAEWEARLIAPEQGVSERFLKLGLSLAGKPEAERAYGLRLWEALPRKVGRARELSMRALLADREAPWKEELREIVAREFSSMSEEGRARILQNYWPQVKALGTVDGLEASLASPRLNGMAMSALREISPERAELVVRAELQEPKLRLPAAFLTGLPEASLPDLDEVLLARREDLLIARYASAAILARVREEFEASRSELGCIGPIVFYFLRHDPVHGKELLRRELSREKAPPICYDVSAQFSNLGRRAYSEALEEVAIAALQDEKVPVKLGAAELLGRFGTHAAREPLWQALAYLEQWWRGRELNQEARALELRLAHALAQSEAWKLDENEKAELRRLCRTDACRMEAR